MGLAVDPYAVGDELAGPIGKGLLELTRHLEHERAGVGRLADDAGDPQRVEGVVTPESLHMGGWSGRRHDSMIMEFSETGNATNI